MRIQLVGAAVAVLAGAFVVWWGKDHIEGTVAGLALLYALQFTDALKYLVRQHALLEMQMNSVSRVQGVGSTTVAVRALASVVHVVCPSDWGRGVHAHSMQAVAGTL